MKKALARFNEAYPKAFQQSRLLTQIFAFPMAVIIFLQFFDLIYLVNTYEGEVSPELRLSVKTDLTVLLTAAALFASRFILLFSKRKVSFWISQIVWFATILFINSQIVPNTLCTKNALPAFDETASFLLIGYLLVSPIRQIITLAASIFVCLQNSEK